MDYIDKLSLEEIEKIEFLTEEEIEKLSFLEQCMYMEFLNKIKKRYLSLKNSR